MAKRKPTQPLAMGPLFVMPGYHVKPLSADVSRQRWPHQIVFWDTETTEGADGVHLFALAYAKLFLRQPDHSYEPGGDVLAHDPAVFWDAIHGWTRSGKSMRLYAANQTFDLGASEWYRHLWGRLGYQADIGKDMIWIASDDSPYLSLKGPKRKQRLSFVDTQSLHIGSPAQLGADLGMPARPGLEDPEDRCRWDVEALAGGVLRYLGHLRDLGVRPSDPTGTGTGFAVLRTRFLPEQSVVHHTDQALYEAEDASRYGGRREAWQHGPIAEPLEEWDYENAHLRICLEPLPSKAKVVAGPATGTDVLTLQEWYVETTVPCVPYRDEGKGLIYPVGRFPATLWGAEAAMAMDAGATLTPNGRFWHYEPTTCMAPFAEWCLAELETTPDPVWRRVLKSWSHVVVGKWGQAQGRYEPLAEGHPSASWPEEWRIAPFIVAHGKVPEQYGGFDRVLHSELGAVGIVDNDHPAEHANYAIQSYVMAQTRIRLWRAMLVAGLENIVHVNGDGLIVTRLGGNRLRRKAPAGLRLKKTYQAGVDVRNAQGVLDRDPDHPVHKISGLPRGAIPAGHHRFLADVWTQSLLGAPVRRSGAWVLPEGPLGRARRSDGQTGAYRVAREPRW